MAQQERNELNIYLGRFDLSLSVSCCSLFRIYFWLSASEQNLSYEGRFEKGRKIGTKDMTNNGIKERILYQEGEMQERWGRKKKRIRTKYASNNIRN